MIEPIKPGEHHTVFNGPLYEKAVAKINEALSLGIWHDEIFVRNDQYHAVLLDFNMKPLLSHIAESYTAAGWDCFCSPAYDARGPHFCFYVHKKHFNK